MYIEIEKEAVFHILTPDIFWIIYEKDSILSQIPFCEYVIPSARRPLRRASSLSMVSYSLSSEDRINYVEPVISPQANSQNYSETVIDPRLKISTNIKELVRQEN